MFIYFQWVWRGGGVEERKGGNAVVSRPSKCVVDEVRSGSKSYESIAMENQFNLQISQSEEQQS